MDPIKNQYYVYNSDLGTTSKISFNDANLPVSFDNAAPITNVPYICYYYDANFNFNVSVAIFYTAAQSRYNMTGVSALANKGSYPKYNINISAAANPNAISPKTFDVYNFEPLANGVGLFSGFTQFEVCTQIDNAPAKTTIVPLFYTGSTFYNIADNSDIELLTNGPAAPASTNVVSSFILKDVGRLGNSNSQYQLLNNSAIVYNAPYFSLITSSQPNSGLQYILCVAVFGKNNDPSSANQAFGWTISQNSCSIDTALNTATFNLVINKSQSAVSNALSYAIYISQPMLMVDIKKWSINLDFAGFSVATPKPPAKKGTIRLGSMEHGSWKRPVIKPVFNPKKS